MFDTHFTEDFIQSLSTVLSDAEDVSINSLKETSGIWLFSKDNDVTELRLSIQGSRSVTISRVQLVHTRIGTLTKIFELLLNFCSSNGIRSIVVQSVITKEMAAWCLKNGFEPHPLCSFAVDDYIVGDYILNLADIASA